MGVGLALIFGVMRIINFAHGEFVAIGMYTAIIMYKVYGLDPYVSMLIALPAGFLLGVLLERLVLSRLIDTPGGSTLLPRLRWAWCSPTPCSSSSELNLNRSIFLMRQLRSHSVACVCPSPSFTQLARPSGSWCSCTSSSTALNWAGPSALPPRTGLVPR